MAMNGNNLGDEIKAAVDTEIATLSQSSDPADHNAYRVALWRGIGNAIVNHIKNNATIESLSANQTPAGQGPHTHNVSTVESTGKIK